MTYAFIAGRDSVRAVCEAVRMLIGYPPVYNEAKDFPHLYTYFQPLAEKHLVAGTDLPFVL